MPVPVIDLFAGPGGLSEGFASLKNERNERTFRVGLSIEKDEVAHRTLTLRALVRAFGSKLPDCYYDFIRGKSTREDLFARKDIRAELECARSEAIHAELGKTAARTVDALIRRALDGTRDWVLIGGPPCQAYSVVGRSRRRGADPEAFENDEKHFLYREYLRVLKEFAPKVFVMENVKGILSSTHGGKPIFERIVRDLRTPGNGTTYRIASLVSELPEEKLRPGDFVIASERYGIPQARHRVILLGVRSDVPTHAAQLLQPQEHQISVAHALRGMPSIRSTLSRQNDSHESWCAALQHTVAGLSGWKNPLRQQVERAIVSACRKSMDHVSTGAAFIKCGYGRGAKSAFHDWIFDPLLEGVIQHESRSHMASDLARYMFASSFAGVFDASPRLVDFPPKLLPEHANIASDDVPFKDRFRVQLAGKPSTTVVSHIAKDGHYYVHPDASQCRSLTVREAARLQTFPDNYFFEGNRTEQYHQVGNAVPPLLARQIAEVVARIVNSDAR